MDLFSFCEIGGVRVDMPLAGGALEDAFFLLCTLLLNSTFALFLLSRAEILFPFISLLFPLLLSVLISFSLHEFWYCSFFKGLVSFTSVLVLQKYLPYACLIYRETKELNIQTGTMGVLNSKRGEGNWI